MILSRSLCVSLGLLIACSPQDDPVFVELTGDVSDAATGLPVHGADVIVRDALGNETSVVTDDDGQWRTTVILAGAEPLPIDIDVVHENYVGTIYHYQVRLPPESDGRLELRPGSVESARSVLIPGIPVAPVSLVPGTIGGNVFNATVNRETDSDPWFINGLELSLREGMRTLDGDPVAIAVSGQDAGKQGDYQFADLPAGTYTLAVDGGSEFSDAFVTVVSVGGTVRLEQNIGTAAAISEDDFRFVVSWGVTPFDLDSHLWGPSRGSADGLPFHIYFGDKLAPTGSTAPFGTLDVDDTSSYGPETVTLLDRARGRYRYYIHDFSNKEAASSTAMSASGARIQVWSAGAYDSFEITPGVDATVWHVADIDGPTGWVYFVNGFEHEELPPLVGDLGDDG